MKKPVQHWIQKAQEDLKGAKLLADDPELWPLSCFHCHQAAEKSLKAYLVDKGIPWPRVHDLGHLLTLCSQVEPTLETVREDAIFLNPFYTGTRYPIRVKIPITEARVKKALAAAELISQLILSHLSGTEEPYNERSG